MPGDVRAGDDPLGDPEIVSDVISLSSSHTVTGPGAAPATTSAACVSPRAAGLGFAGVGIKAVLEPAADVEAARTAQAGEERSGRSEVRLRMDIVLGVRPNEQGGAHLSLGVARWPGLHIGRHG